MASQHPLDRPAWQALTTRQSHLSLGDAHARRFLPSYSPFAAAADDSPVCLTALAGLVPEDGAIAILQAGDCPLPPGTSVAKSGAGVQMIAHSMVPSRAGFAMEPLTDADAPAMIALATLTEPGPFLPRTHELGNFVGIKLDGRLVAMAGERMKLPGYTEVSGVCTHPDYRGKGYADALTRIVAQRIFERGETPFLHAYVSNTGAIRLYESLGFSVRCPVTMTVLVRG